MKERLHDGQLRIIGIFENDLLPTFNELVRIPCTPTWYLVPGTRYLTMERYRPVIERSVPGTLYPWYQGWLYPGIPSSWYRFQKQLWMMPPQEGRVAWYQCTPPGTSTTPRYSAWYLPGGTYYRYIIRQPPNGS